jgi:hypothetical protein
MADTYPPGNHIPRALSIEGGGIHFNEPKISKPLRQITSPAGVSIKGKRNVRMAIGVSLVRGREGWPAVAGRVMFYEINGLDDLRVGRDACFIQLLIFKDLLDKGLGLEKRWDTPVMPDIPAPGVISRQG